MFLDHYITLGGSGLRVSPFCLGAMTFGEDLGWGSSVEESQQIIDRYIELGGNFIDTANFYTKSHSEPEFPRCELSQSLCIALILVGVIGLKLFWAD